MALRQLMRVRWSRFINNDLRYRHGTLRERRFLELQISLAIAVHQLRWKRNLSQKQLGQLMGISQGRVSKLEQIKTGVSLDMYVQGLLVLGASDEDVARAFNVLECPAVQELRRRAALPYYSKPRPEPRSA